MRWAASSVIALAVALGGLSALHDVNGQLRPFDVLVLSMVGVLFAWLCLDLIARRPLDAMWARLIVVAAATTFGLFVGAPWAWVGYAAAAAVLVAMFVRSHRRQRVVADPYELRADVTAR